MAVAIYRQEQAMGWMAGLPSATSTQALSGAGSWAAYAFVADAARTISAARVFVSAVTGTLAGTDITCDLYDSTGANGVPGSSAEAGKVPTATITASGWYDFTGFTTALTAGQTYWLVFKNVNATPASNNCTLRVVTGIANNFLVGTAATRFYWGFATSANSGSTWSANANQSGLRISYADGSYDGVAASNTAAAVVGDGVYSARESGVKFTSPANGVLKVAGIAMFLSTKTGSPTGSGRFGLWTGSTPANLAYTQSIPNTSITAIQWVYAYFSSVQTLQPGTITRITLGETTQSDASTARFNLREITWDTDSNSTILLPWEGTCVKTYFDGTSTWTDTSGSIFGHALLLDTAGEFGAGASGGVLLNPGMTGGMQRSS